MKVYAFKLFLYSFFLMNLSMITLSAREGGGGGGGHHGGGEYHPNSGGYHQNYGNYHNYRENQNYGGYGGGYGGGYVNEGYNVYPYPPQGSQPGMSDDSNALYNSYLQKHGQGY